DLFLPSRLFWGRAKATVLDTRRGRRLILGDAAYGPRPERTKRRSAKGDIDEGAHGLSQRLARSREPGHDLRLRPWPAAWRCGLRRGPQVLPAPVQAPGAPRPALPLLQLHAHAASHDGRRDGEADTGRAGPQPGPSRAQ